ncbi:MAG: NADH-quinone oxidoreductase subunit A [Acidimicrobiia bacterium]|nr:NADH-quinone oxidoreductase subunit A [Acidimicrobiia bacterium]
MSQYLPILTMALLAFGFGAGSFFASQLLAPSRKTKAKTASYECGIVSDNEPVERFPVKFYLVAMAFIVLDVEIIFLYPFATILRELGAYGLGVMGVFLGVLIVPFAYLLSTGALDWGPMARISDQIVRPIMRSDGSPEIFANSASTGSSNTQVEESAA